MKRRQFLKTAGVGAFAASLGSTTKVWGQSAPIKWKMVTSWPPGFPILQEGAERFAKRVDELSAGKLKIEVYAGGVLVPALGGFDAVSAGNVECCSSASYYWAGKCPAAQFFTAQPFGFMADQMSAWLLGGGGLDLWNEVYGKSNMVAIPLMNTGQQMAGWFRKEIKGPEDLKGLKFRTAGLGGKAMAKLGVAVQLLPGAEIVPALEKGAIDAAEWVGPAHDLRLGFPKVAKFYYYPGWAEPCGQTELMINKKAWESLPKDLKGIVFAASLEVNAWGIAQFDVQNAGALAEIKKQFPDVQVKRLPESVLKALRKAADEAMADEAAADKTGDFKRVWDAYLKFRAQMDDYFAVQYLYRYDEYASLWLPKLK
jgi:TRAP-type mannitol/chloroaromatic compound transport system substrate-binding protein